MLSLYINVTDGMVVYPKIIERRLREYLPFLATENILMEAVKRGGDRQALHEKIRQHSMESSRRMKEEGADCDLLERLAGDLGLRHDDGAFADRARSQALHRPLPGAGGNEFLRDYIQPIFDREGDDGGGCAGQRVKYGKLSPDHHRRAARRF